MAVPPSDPIRQGDIFLNLPRLDLVLDAIAVLSDDDEMIETSWDQIVSSGNVPSQVQVMASVRPVAAIVASQDCDASWSPEITLCEIGDFRVIDPLCANTQTSKSWVKILTQQARLNLKWFYLPPDPGIGFDRKMAVDFRIPIRIARTDLERLRHLRTGRLNGIADEHFRERISEFFRRYPYDEWYPFDNEELAAYLQSHKDVKPFPWQKVEDPGTLK